MITMDMLVGGPSIVMNATLIRKQTRGCTAVSDLRMAKSVIIFISEISTLEENHIIKTYCMLHTLQCVYMGLGTGSSCWIDVIILTSKC